MPPKVAVVALDISKDNDHFDLLETFDVMSVKDKAVYLATRIETLCQEMVRKPEIYGDKWVVAWREYGITASNGSRYLSPDDRDEILGALLPLTEQYPQLSIVTGTMAVARKFTHFQLDRVTDKISRAYEESKPLLEQERSIGESSGFEMQRHLEGAQRVLSQAQVDNETTQSAGVTVVKNTSFVLSKGTGTKHSKTAAFNEVSDQLVFQPGRGKTKNCIVELEDEVLNQNIGVEICREHQLGVLKRECQSNTKKPPLVQMVVSDGMLPIFENMVGDYFVLVDSQSKPVLYQNTTSSGTEAEVVLFTNDLLKTDLTLQASASQKKPISPVDVAKAPGPVDQGKETSNPEMSKTSEYRAQIKKLCSTTNSPPSELQSDRESESRANPF